MDMRIKSYYGFLISINQKEFAHAEIIKETYRDIFNIHIEKDVDSSVYKKCIEKVGADAMISGLQLALEPGKAKYLQEHYSTFKNVAQLFVYGLHNLVLKRYDDATQALYWALKRDKFLVFDQAKREAQIYQFIRLSILLYFDENVNVKINPDGCKKAMVYDLFIINKSDPLREYLIKRFLLLQKNYSFLKTLFADINPYLMQEKIQLDFESVLNVPLPVVGKLNTAQDSDTLFVRLGELSEKVKHDYRQQFNLIEDLSRAQFRP